MTEVHVWRPELRPPAGPGCSAQVSKALNARLNGPAANRQGQLVPVLAVLLQAVASGCVTLSLLRRATVSRSSNRQSSVKGGTCSPVAGGGAKVFLP